MTVEEWDRVMETNMRGVFLTCQAAARSMKAGARAGKIITISSGAYASGRVGAAHYCASKAGVVIFTRVLPMIGWDEAGHRLGYGGGFFDRTLASLAKKPVVIGVSYELVKMKTIRPQNWDIPLDWVVTERGTYRRDPEGLVFLGEPVAGEPGSLASPVCYAAEVDPFVNDLQEHSRWPR